MWTPKTPASRSVWAGPSTVDHRPASASDGEALRAIDNASVRSHMAFGQGIRQARIEFRNPRSVRAGDALRRPGDRRVSVASRRRSFAGDRPCIPGQLPAASTAQTRPADHHRNAADGHARSAACISTTESGAGCTSRADRRHRAGAGPLSSPCPSAACGAGARRRPRDHLGHCPQSRSSPNHRRCG